MSVEKICCVMSALEKKDYELFIRTLLPVHCDASTAVRVPWHRRADPGPGARSHGQPGLPGPVLTRSLPASDNEPPWPGPDSWAGRTLAGAPGFKGPNRNC